MRTLLPMHIELYRALRALRDPETGVSANIGKTILPWVNSLKEPYVAYCANLIDVSISEYFYRPVSNWRIFFSRTVFFFQIKFFLDNRREEDKDFRDFLQRCLESPFSRKLDLWSYLGKV